MLISIDVRKDRRWISTQDLYQKASGIIDIDHLCHCLTTCDFTAPSNNVLFSVTASSSSVSQNLLALSHGSIGALLIQTSKSDHFWDWNSYKL